MSSDKLLAPPYQETAKRIGANNGQYILALPDQMRLNFTHHAAKNDWGLIQHNLLWVDDQNEALGLMDVQFFDDSAFDLARI